MSKLVGNVLSDVSSCSPYSQIFIGATSGFITGIITIKFGKMVALAVGCSILILEVAHEEGYIKIDWSKFKHQSERRMDKNDRRSDRNWLDKLTKCFESNTRLCVSFIAGVFLGIGCA